MNKKVLESIKGKVKELLIQYPECRDNDNLLIIKVWCEDNPRLRDRTHSFSAFGIDFIKGKYSSAESIRRARQLLQAKYPELRGSLWYDRKSLAEQIRLNINN